MNKLSRSLLALALTASGGSIALAQPAGPLGQMSTPTTSSLSLSSGTISPGTISPGTISPGAISPGAISVMAVRISGLVCDLCINEIQAHLKKLPNVVAAMADPRDGVAALSLRGPGPSDEAVTKVFTNAGYSVHAVTRSTSVPWASFVKAPTVAMTVWWGSANEQKKVLASTPAGLSVCAERGQLYSTQHVDTKIWGGSPGFSSQSDLPHKPF